MQIRAQTHANFKPSSLINPSELPAIAALSKTKPKHIKQLRENRFSLWNGRSPRALLCTASLVRRAALWSHAGLGPVCVHTQSDAPSRPQPGEFRASFLSHWSPMKTRKKKNKPPHVHSNIFSSQLLFNSQKSDSESTRAQTRTAASQPNGPFHVQ